MNSIKKILFLFSIDPYVKVYLVVGGKRLKKKKSSARKNTNDPVWNEAYAFSVPSSTLATAAIEVYSILI